MTTEGMAKTDLEALLSKQLELQIDHMGGDPRELFKDNPEEWANFMRWNAWALTEELGEAMGEVGWKPWATSRHLNHDAFLKEMVDLFHFFMNLLLAGNPDTHPQDIARDFAHAYFLKNQKNAQRQVDGYDGVSDKCLVCHRELLGGQCAEGHIN